MAFFECPDGRKIYRTMFNDHLTMEQACGLVPAPKPSDAFSEDITAVYGPPPSFADYRDAPIPSQAHRIAMDKYRQDVRYHQMSGWPPWASSDQIHDATAVFHHWNMPTPVYYKGRYDWMAKFPSNSIKFEAPASTAIRFSHHVVSMYQIRVILEGGTVATRHPFVPPHLGADFDPDTV